MLLVALVVQVIQEVRNVLVVQDLKDQAVQDILEDLKDHLALLDRRRDLKDLVQVILVDHLQDFQDNLRDPLVRRVQAASRVHRVVVRKALVAQVDIPVVDQAAHRFQVDLLDQEVFLGNLGRWVRRSRRKVLRSQIVSTCLRGLDKYEAKLSIGI